MSKRFLKIVEASSIQKATSALIIDEQTLSQAHSIVTDVRSNGDKALRKYAEQFQDVIPKAPIILNRTQLLKAFDEIEKEKKTLLQRTAERIRTFAQAQRNSLQELSVDIPGGKAGHRIIPVNTAGCYAPGGRFPLPSSLLMTAITARVAGVKNVVAASPHPDKITQAAAAVAEVDLLVSAGGSHAISALAYGTETIPACDMVVGPGNRYVTAAKKLVAGDVGIDMLAGPTELVILADSSADPSFIAADLLAQAEHDVDALPILILFDKKIADKVEEELSFQLPKLRTAENAKKSLQNGFVTFVSSNQEAVDTCNLLAPEHLELMLKDPAPLVSELQNYGALFIGQESAEVLGDYGAGPNHVLPTSGTARFTGGLSVFHFLKINTWLEISDKENATELLLDAVELAQQEGLDAHRHSAKLRLPQK